MELREFLIERERKIQEEITAQQERERLKMERLDRFLDARQRLSDAIMAELRPLIAEDLIALAEPRKFVVRTKQGRTYAASYDVKSPDELVAYLHGAYELEVPLEDATPKFLELLKHSIFVKDVEQAVLEVTILGQFMWELEEGWTELSLEEQVGRAAVRLGGPSHFPECERIITRAYHNLCTRQTLW